MRALVFNWFKTNSIILINSGSLIGTTAVTSVLGFAYWWLAARLFPPETVGFASAAISAMTLLGTLSIVGMGTLLIGELPRYKDKEASLISAALLLVGGVGGFLGITFAAAAAYLSADFQALRATIGNVALFAVGVGLIAMMTVLDQAMIGLLRGELQFWRNALFSAAKLAALFVVGLWLSHAAASGIIATWILGNVFSLAVLAVFTLQKGRWPRGIFSPQWRLLQKLGSAALKHHGFNLMLQAPALILPVVVTALLSARTNAWFYISLSIANFPNYIPTALTLVLYAASSAQPATLTRMTRQTLGLAFAATVLANCVLWFGSGQILGLFGHSYAEHATWSLRILGIATFPFIIKNHYVAICRTQRRLASATFLTITGSALELVGATLGGWFGGLTGLSFGWFAAVCVEAVLMFHPVYKVVRAIDVSIDEGQLQDARPRMT